MAAATNTIAGQLQLNDASLASLNVSDLLDDSPVTKALFAKGASEGSIHKYLKQTTASGAAFRALNAGLAKTYSQDTLVTDTLQLMDASFTFDKGRISGSVNHDVLSLELARSLRAMFYGLESQIFYGVGADAGGFVGFSDSTAGDALADAMVYNAGGTTASTQTSVFLIRSGDDDAALILGNDGMMDISDPFDTLVYPDPTTDAKTYPAVGVSVLGYAGLQLGSAQSVGRIANLHASDSNAQLTDDMLYEALSLFPAGRQPNMIAMNRQSLKQLRSSRTATNVTGAPAPRPTEVEGIPIVVTDAIINTEAVEV